MTDYEKKYYDTVDIVTNEVRNALLSTDIDAVRRFSKDLCEAESVFLIGVGRVMMSLEAFTKRLSHLGIKAHCVGDITEPALTKNDILVVGSGSGESIFPVVIAKKAKELGVKKIIHIGSNPNGSMSKYMDYMVRVPVRTRLYLEDEIDSKQIMTSLFEQTLLLLGDVIAMMIVEDKGLDLKELWKYHANLE